MNYNYKGFNVGVLKMYSTLNDICREDHYVPLEEPKMIWIQELVCRRSHRDTVYKEQPYEIRSFT